MWMRVMVVLFLAGVFVLLIIASRDVIEAPM
jgi:hypothetical protein